MSDAKTATRESLSIAAVVAPIIVVACYWPALPARVPSHFNAQGQPDDWAAKITIVAVPILSVVLWIALRTVREFPGLFNYPVKITDENRARQEFLAIRLIDWLGFEVSLVFAYLTIQQVRVSLGHASGLGASFLWIALLAVFGTIGLYLRAAIQARVANHA